MKKKLKKEKPAPRIDFPHRLDYLMSINDMQKVIQNQFSEMEKNGLIVSQDQFEKIKDEYDTLAHSAPTKISGTDALKNYIENSPELKEKYHVLPYIIVVLNHAKQISIKVSFYNQQMPMLYSLESIKDSSVDEIAIYFKKDGSTCLSQYSPEVTTIANDLKKNKKEGLLCSSKITKDESGQCFISHPNLDEYLLANPGNASSRDELNDFEEYAYERFFHVNGYYNNGYHTKDDHIFSYDLTGGKISQEPNNNMNFHDQKDTREEKSPDTNPNVTGNSFSEKFSALCTWIRKNKLPTFFLVSGAGIALYWIVTYALGNKKISVRSAIR